MKQVLYILIFTSNFNAFIAFGQKSKTVLNREIAFHAGPAVFQGDVTSGVFFSEKKINQSSLGNSNFNIGAGLNYFLNDNFSFKSNINVLQLCGDDVWGKNALRMLKFRTYLLDFSALMEYNYTNRYFKRSIISASTGIAIINFYPFGKYNDKWYNLRKTGTEGQGLINGPKKYKPFAFSIPINMAYFFCLNNRDKLGIEFCFRKTFTDYIDDVSGKYYDNSELLIQKGEPAAYLADPKTVKSKSGTYRGNPGKNDNYTFVNFTYKRLLGVKYIIKY